MTTLSFPLLLLKNPDPELPIVAPIPKFAFTIRVAVVGVVGIAVNDQSLSFSLSICRTMKCETKISCKSKVLNNSLDGSEVGLCCFGDASCEYAMRESKIWTNRHCLKDETQKFALSSDLRCSKKRRIIVDFV